MRKTDKPFKPMIALIKKGSNKPVKIFNDWWKAGTYCDENIKRDKGCDPTQYRLDSVTGFKKWWYSLFYNFA